MINPASIAKGHHTAQLDKAAMGTSSAGLVSWVLMN
jgi:hypothetical protein